MHTLQSQSSRTDNLTELPAADELASACSQLLIERISSEIADQNGCIGFDRFMELALYEPGLGYYSAGSRKFGRGGDFITAPEISSLFSYCIARQCVPLLRSMDKPVILELGAGSGIMAGDVLQYLAGQDCLPDKYLILETSADLRERQFELLRERIPEQLSRVHWLDALPETPLHGVVLGNELLDALPVKRLRYAQGKWQELCVERQNGSFNWCLRDPEEHLLGRIAAVLGPYAPDLPDGYTTEINTRLPAFINSLSDIMAQGILLFIDYGYPRHEYYHPQRSEGTLLCHYRHRVHGDPFRLPGLQDITASVDFTALAEAGVDAGLSVTGYCSQANFLISSGLAQLMEEMDVKDQRKSLELSGQIKQLTLPGEMGERFKAIALGRGWDGRLPGFQLLDHRNRL